MSRDNRDPQTLGAAILREYARNPEKGIVYHADKIEAQRKEAAKAASNGQLVQRITN